jgi:hypothetical protein
VLRWGPAERALARGQRGARSATLPGRVVPAGATSQGSNTSLSSLQPAAMSSRFCARPGNARGVVSSDFDGSSFRPRSGPTSADAMVGVRNVSADMVLQGPHSDALLCKSTARVSVDGQVAVAAVAAPPPQQQQVATAAAHHLASLPSAVQGPRSDKLGPQAKRISRSVDTKLFLGSSELVERRGGSVRSDKVGRGGLLSHRRSSEAIGRPSAALTLGGRVTMQALLDSVNASDNEEGEGKLGFVDLVRRGWPADEEGNGDGGTAGAAGVNQGSAGGGARQRGKAAAMREGPRSSSAGQRRRGLAAFGFANGTVCCAVLCLQLDCLVRSGLPPSRALASPTMT